MRLIDADALIQHTYSTVIDGVETDIIDASNIDNAPIVEAYTDTDLIEENKKGFNTAKRLYQRPQGEWILVDDTEKFIAKCSVCGRIEDSRMIKDYPFCHCGALMRG